MTESERNSDFVRLMVRHQSRIYGFVRAVVPNQADAEDIVQDVAIVLWKKFAQFESQRDLDGDFLAWSLQTARLKIKSFLRTQRAERVRFSAVLVDHLAEVASEPAYLGSDLQAAFEHCIGRLSDSDRKLLLARYEPGASVAAIADRLSRPVQTIYSRLKRSRQKLLGCIERQLGKEASQ